MFDILLYILGAFGATLYSFPLYISGLSSVPPVRFALSILLFSVLVGTVVAPILVPLLVHWKPWLGEPNPYPLAVGVGLLANPLVPVFVKRFTGWADRFNPTGVK